LPAAPCTARRARSGIVTTELGAIAVPEIEFVQVRLQVWLAAVPINAGHAALKETEQALNDNVIGAECERPDLRGVPLRRSC
jgi:hypothetical protein